MKKQAIITTLFVSALSINGAFAEDIVKKDMVTSAQSTVNSEMRDAVGKVKADVATKIEKNVDINAVNQANQKVNEAKNATADVKNNIQEYTKDAQNKSLTSSETKDSQANADCKTEECKKALQASVDCKTEECKKALQASVDCKTEECKKALQASVDCKTEECKKALQANADCKTEECKKANQANADCKTEECKKANQANADCKTEECKKNAQDEATGSVNTDMQQETGLIDKIMSFFKN